MVSSQVIYGSFDSTERQSLQVLNGLSLPLGAKTLTGATTGGIANGAGDTPWGVSTLPSSGFSRLVALLVVATPASTVGDTLDVYVDASLDSGTTWCNIIHFVQFLGNGTAKKYIAKTASAVAGSITDETADIAAAATPLQFFGNAVRVRTQRVNGSGSLSFPVTPTLLLLP